MTNTMNSGTCVRCALVVPMLLHLFASHTRHMRCSEISMINLLVPSADWYTLLVGGASVCGVEFAHRKLQQTKWYSTGHSMAQCLWQTGNWANFLVHCLFYNISSSDGVRSHRKHIQQPKHVRLMHGTNAELPFARCRHSAKLQVHTILLFIHLYILILNP